MCIRDRPVELAKSELIKKGSRVAIMALGSMVKTAVDAVKLLEACLLYTSRCV